MKIASYTKVSRGDGFLFNVTPAPKSRLNFSPRILMMGFLCSLAVCGIVFGVDATLDSVDSSWYLGVSLAVLAFIMVIAWGFVKYVYLNNRCSPSSFTVYPNAIEINGQKINKEEIRGVMIKNAFNNILLSTTISAPLELEIDSLNQINYAINVETSNGTIQLAEGMDKITAYILHSDISRILEFG